MSATNITVSIVPIKQFKGSGEQEQPRITFQGLTMNDGVTIEYQEDFQTSYTGSDRSVMTCDNPQGATATLTVNVARTSKEYPVFMSIIAEMVTNSNITYRFRISHSSFIGTKNMMATTDYGSLKNIPSVGMSTDASMSIKVPFVFNCPNFVETEQ